jgi:hypothetical protein
VWLADCGKAGGFTEYIIDHDEIAHASKAFENWKAEHAVSTALETDVNEFWNQA